eukprot:TRINITY_DN74850_c0_g1_i1.p1 TRINITY_DN74850_c0_g1~~TRINITY_DN74850_c0_g1_i1.p1  ORF type:complete len:314 (+),score=25.31 TRINITY_DN74850_c0_g1_i1:119-1060(+)
MPEMASILAFAETPAPSLRCPIDADYQWSVHSRKGAITVLIALRRQCGSLPQPCAELLLRFLLEPVPRLTSWSESIAISRDGRIARSRGRYQLRARSSALGLGFLTFTAQPMTVSDQGRYVELLVSKLAGDANCGVVLGVTACPPGLESWGTAGPPGDIRCVPKCIWGLPRCSTPRFRVGNRIGYLVTKLGELVFYVDSVEVGRSSCASLVGDSDLWLVVDLSHDVSEITILDVASPSESSVPPRHLLVEAVTSVGRNARGLASWVCPTRRTALETESPASAWDAIRDKISYWLNRALAEAFGAGGRRSLHSR